MRLLMLPELMLQSDCSEYKTTNQRLRKLEIVCSDIALSLRTLLLLNYARQVLMIDLEDD